MSAEWIQRYDAAVAEANAAETAFKVIDARINEAMLRNKEGVILNWLHYSEWEAWGAARLVRDRAQDQVGALLAEAGHTQGWV